ncbi:uncharacterized protein LOC116167722 [Photinus pyralis]|uniref:uncharacterized protein LOC116167722 n=1 Tax=Photinus pyralis TaxID=7054 RepID=UPI0012677B7B|nr:uncharacterized protein LOC116167722 [Photinus pyralis]
MELPHVASKRIRFLRQYKDFKEKDLYQFVFLDETWILQNGTIQHSWQDSNERSVKTIKTDGKRQIILHAGNEKGFIPGANLIFASKTCGDYHGEMNQTNFLHWFQNQLLPNLSEPSVIIIDNAPYHNMEVNKAPNVSWKKGDIQSWLTNEGIIYSEQMLKSELLLKVSQNKPEKTYFVDQLAEQYGHKVLRLPPYHCIFNPIELIWGITKTYYNKHIGRDGKTEADCLNMWQEAVNVVTPDMWKNSIKHTEGEIMKWYEREKMLDMQDIDTYLPKYRKPQFSPKITFLTIVSIRLIVNDPPNYRRSIKAKLTGKEVFVLS